MKEEKKEKNYFETLNSINVSDKTEKKNGLTYLSWAWAWTEVKKLFPNATYNIKKFGENQLPYVYDENTGYMVFTDMTIEGITHEMWLPVMDGANQAMKNIKYTYKVYKYTNGRKVWNKQTNSYEMIDKEVEPATMFDINKTIMRCLTKNIAMFGLGLYIYAGEDLPENEETPKKAPVKSSENHRDMLIKYIKDKEMDFAEVAKEHKLNAKSSQESFKKVLKVLQEDNLKKDLQDTYDKHHDEYGGLD